MLIKINKTKSVIYFFGTVKRDLLDIAIFSIAVTIFAQIKYFQNLMIPLGLVATVGTAMSLILAFRTAQAYDRWWEARIIWGAIVNDSRTFIRQLQLFLPADQKDEVKQFVERQSIWCKALSESLRKLPFSDEVKKYMVEHQIEASNVPNALLDLHSKQLKSLVDRGLLSEFREVQIDTTISRFCDSMGRCERIKSTVFPENYSKLIHAIIYFFALMLPFSLDDNFVYIKGALTVLIPSFFIVIEQTAILMQNPFENKPMDTPMTAISTTISMNLMQMIGEKVEVAPTVEQDFYYIL